MENGENGIYNLIANDKNIIFRPKVEITPKDIEEIPPLRQLVDTIADWEALLKRSEGRDAYIIKDALIEMRKDQYVIKNGYRKPIVPTKLVKSKHCIELDEEVYINDEDRAIGEGVSLLRPEVVSAILCNYSKLKESAYGNFEGDLWYLLYDFEVLAEEALKDYPVY
jgi:hypothetical protein